MTHVRLTKGRQDGEALADVQALAPVTRRRFLLAAGACAAWAATPRGQATSGIPKAAARYQSEPRGSERCGGCRHYLAARSDQGRCEVVAGAIDPYGWCRHFASPAEGSFLEGARRP